MENSAVPHCSKLKTVEATALSLNKSCGGQEKHRKNKNSDLLFRDSGKLSTQPSFRLIKNGRLLKFKVKNKKGKLSSIPQWSHNFVMRINTSCRQERSP